MSISPFSIYLITRCSAISTLLFVLCILSLVVLIIGSLVNVLSAGDRDEEAARELFNAVRMRWAAIVFAVSATLCALVPSTKEAVAIFTIPKVVNSRMVQEDIPQAVRDLWNRTVLKSDDKENTK